MADHDTPADCRYTKEDEWVRVDGDRALIGITDYAQQQLGDIVFVELPEVGSEVSQGDAFGVIESVKAVSDLYAPISGTVSEVNEALRDQPELVNADCYADGWIIAIEEPDAAEIEELMDAAAYGKYIEERKE